MRARGGSRRVRLSCPCWGVAALGVGEVKREWGCGKFEILV